MITRKANKNILSSITNHTPGLQIGVMGGAFKYTPEAIIEAYRVGKFIAEKGCVLITGATTGIPYAAVLGAKTHNGVVVGISPASNARQHADDFGKPLNGYDAVVYTGMGYNGREPINIASCDGIIFIGGEFGTLIEFGQGFYEGKVLGVLTGVGGISDKLKQIVGYMETNFGSEIIYDSESLKLVERVIKAVENAQTYARHIHKSRTHLGEEVRNILGEYIE
jgi:uncharacterized protein (TIGR00725 family)